MKHQNVGFNYTEKSRFCVCVLSVKYFFGIHVL